MILTTIPEAGISRLSGKGEKAEMPWLAYWQGMSVHGDPRERWTASRVSELGVFRMFHWEPQAAEAVLAYIATGSFSGHRGAVPSGLLGPDGEPLV